MNVAQSSSCGSGMAQAQEVQGLKQSAMVVAAISRHAQARGLLATLAHVQARVARACAADVRTVSHPRPVGRCARSMLGPAGAIKICAATDSAGAFIADDGGVAVCNGIGLLEALSVAHPAGSLLKEAVHGQQVLRFGRCLSTACRPPPAAPLQSDCIVPVIHMPPLLSQQRAGDGGACAGAAVSCAQSLQ